MSKPEGWQVPPARSWQEEGAEWLGNVREIVQLPEPERTMHIGRMVDVLDGQVRTLQPQLTESGFPGVFEDPRVRASVRAFFYSFVRACADSVEKGKADV